MISRRKAIYLFIGGVLLASPALAITTVPVEVVCPICKTKNSFYDYASWGSYIYMYPSRFQLIFWPYTSSATFYCCKKCHLSLYMWDFKEFSKDKINAVAKILEPVRLSSEFKSYLDIPSSEKLLIAEGIYSYLGRESEFWNHFYRVLGYHFAREGNSKEATTARLKALGIVEKMLLDLKNEGHKKDLLTICASMRHFTGDDTTAKSELQQAAGLRFSDEKLGEERSKNYDAFLSALIKDFLSALESGKVPADTGRDSE